MSDVNILQIISGNAIGTIVGNAESEIRGKLEKDKKKRAETREERFKLLRSEFFFENKSFLNLYEEDKNFNDINKYDCILLDQEYSIINNINNLKSKRSITSTKSPSLFKSIISCGLSDYKKLKTYGCHDAKKWIPLGMQILGKPDIIYEDHNKKTHKLNLETPLTLICNPHHRGINFLNLYEITDPNFSTSSKTKNDDYMLYNLPIPLFDIIKKHQIQAKLRKSRLSGCPTPTPSLNQLNIEKDIGLRLHPYALKSKLIRYLSGNKDQIKVLEIYSGDKVNNNNNNNYNGFSGVIRIYFSKTSARIINNFTKAIDCYVDKLKAEEAEEAEEEKEIKEIKLNSPTKNKIKKSRNSNNSKSNSTIETSDFESETRSSQDETSGSQDETSDFESETISSQDKASGSQEETEAFQNTKL